MTLVYPAAGSVCRETTIETPESQELRHGLQGEWLLAQSIDGRFFLSVPGTFVGQSRLVDVALDSTAGGRPDLLTTQWGLVSAASAEGAVRLDGSRQAGWGWFVKRSDEPN